MASLGTTARACASVRFRWLSAKTPMSLGKPTYMQSSGTVVVVRVQYKRDWIVALHLPCTHIYCVRPENEKSLELCAELEEDVALLVEKLLLSRLTLRNLESQISFHGIFEILYSKFWRPVTLCCMFSQVSPESKSGLSIQKYIALHTKFVQIQQDEDRAAAAALFVIVATSILAARECVNVEARRSGDVDKVWKGGGGGPFQIFEFGTGLLLSGRAWSSQT
ncbi:hypothetical protein EDB83DRAFT_2322422 [Lactarius deliciosus]|nr:hypothetical protein EDB83DRAFT_2322422 [Lactarius deliciosus]